jgi:hypothetical protein
MSYKIVNRVEPKNTKPINFISQEYKLTNFGLINLCSWQEDLNNIIELNTKIININIINIYFPIFKNYFTKIYKSENGFTFKQLIERIVDCGLYAGKYDIKHYPKHYRSENIIPIDFINEYALVSSENKSDINIKNNCIYISLQH